MRMAQGAALRNMQARAHDIQWHEQYECFGVVSETTGNKFRRLAGCERKIKTTFCTGGKFRLASASRRAKSCDRAVRIDARVCGRRGGTLVHSEMERALGMWLLASDVARWMPPGSDWTPSTLAVVHEARSRGWVPLFSEYKVGALDLGLGTAIDLLFVDPRTAVVHNIELKTGYEGVFELASRPGAVLAAPLDFLADSPCNLALVQTSVNQFFLARLGLVPALTQSHVWCVQQTSVGVIVREWLPTPEILAAVPRIIEHLAATPASAKKKPSTLASALNRKHNRQINHIHKRFYQVVLSYARHYLSAQKGVFCV